MGRVTISALDEELIDRLVGHYVANKGLISRFVESIHAHISEAMTDPGSLSGHVHSVKRRMKDPIHLKDKLIRKLLRAQEKGDPFDITEDNLLLRINDLGGYRILHLHTQQMEEIHGALLELLDLAQCDLYETPFANIWDEESRTYFEGVGIRTEVNPRLYSSVHYVIRPRSKAILTYEIQVRTLADEIWGEIDHKINYPYPHESLSCREQIKALARVASSCSRLVDSIVASHRDWSKNDTSIQSVAHLPGPPHVSDPNEG
jgi:ppGpp synthetase/RelA/SpoT-type nucleotidyltranferase